MQFIYIEIPGIWSLLKLPQYLFYCISPPLVRTKCVATQMPREVIEHEIHAH